ncbi:hypothetical protein OPQ81_005311 [Rhizoctonia solani]|nr:hypothetical protein OPQ81_005311 [Rhizoctonia solani]
MVVLAINNEPISSSSNTQSEVLAIPLTQEPDYLVLDSSKWLPVIKEFKHLIEDHEDIYRGFTVMFQQASAVAGISNVRNYKEMLQKINDEIQRAPRYDRSEFVTCSIYRILDKVMCTPTGLATLANPLVNAQFKKIIDVWAAFLSSSESRSVLTSDEGGWFSPIARADMPAFFDTYVSDQDADYGGFKSWDDYFTRQLRPGVRPVEFRDDNTVINSACESTVYWISSGIKEQDYFWLKGQPYSLRDIFHDDPFTNRFVGGTILQCFLSAVTYHRWHSPVNGRVVKTRIIPGIHFSQSPQSPNSSQTDPITSQRFLVSVSTRALVFIDSDNPHIGLMCFIAVGMIDASTCDIRVNPGDRLTKGQEMGMFHFGVSTYCMLFRPSVKVSFNCNTGDLVLVNTAIASVSF